MNGKGVPQRKILGQKWIPSRKNQGGNQIKI